MPSDEEGELTESDLEIVVGGSKEVKLLFENWRKYLKEDELIEKYRFASRVEDSNGAICHNFLKNNWD